MEIREAQRYVVELDVLKMAKINMPALVSEDSQQLGHKAPHGAEYVGMIEVVVLRCHPVSAQPDAGNVPVPQPRSSKAPTEPMPVGKLLKVATSLPLSDDSSVSSETSGPFIGTFDGANDEAPREGTVMPFGGDAGWDKPMPQKSKGTQQTQASLASPAASASKPLNEGSGSAAGALIHPQWHGRNQSQSHFRQDWGQSRRPSSQISQSRSSPQMQAQSKSDGVIGNEAATGSVSGSKQSALGNNGEPVRSGTTGQGTPSVIININQVESPPGLWGARTLSPAVSEVDSWATRKSTHDNWKEGCQASQEPRDSRRPDTSWQAQVTWSDIDRGGQPSDDKKEFAKGSLNNKSLANAPTRGDANNVGNKGSVRQSILLGTLVKSGSLTLSRRMRCGVRQIPILLEANGQLQPMLQLQVTAVSGKARREIAGIVYPQLEVCLGHGRLMRMRKPILVQVPPRLALNSKFQSQADEATRVLALPRKIRTKRKAKLWLTPASEVGGGKKKQFPVAW